MLHPRQLSWLNSLQKLKLSVAGVGARICTEASEPASLPQLPTTSPIRSDTNYLTLVAQFSNIIGNRNS